MYLDLLNRECTLEIEKIKDHLNPAHLFQSEILVLKNSDNNILELVAIAVFILSLSFSFFHNSFLL
jgi:hypothetical protein